MPNNILITPASASIQFSGSATNTIRLQVEPSGSVAFYGNSGSLFGITDSLSGSLMSVNDISGLPILEVFSDDRVVMGTYNRNTLVVTGSRVGIDKAIPNADLDVSGSVLITGSLNVLGSISGTLALPVGTVSSSAQVDYNSIQNKLSGVVSSSAQVQPLLPGGLLSSSLQFNNPNSPFTGSFSGSFFGNGAGLVIFTDTYTFTGNGSTQNFVLSQSYAANSLFVAVAGLTYTNIQDFTLSGPTVTFITPPPSGSNILIRGFINTVTSAGATGSFLGSLSGTASFAVTSSYVHPYGLPIGTVSSSAQIDYNNITNKLSGVVSSSAQVATLLPASTVSSSTASSPSQGTVRVTINGVNTDVDTGLQSGDSPTFAGLTSTGTVLLAGIYSSSGQVTISSTTGYSTFSSSLATVDQNQQLEINALKSTTSSYAINSTIQSQLAGVISSSTQFNALSGTSASFATTASYALTSAGGGLPTGVVSSSTQVAALLPANTVSSSTASSPSQGTVRVTINGVNTDVDTGLQTGDSPTFTGLTATGTVLLAGIVSSSTASSPSQGTVRVTINGTNTDVDTGLQTGDSPSFAGLTVDTNTLFVDAPNNRVGIGTTSPGGPLHILGSTGATGEIRLQSSDGKTFAIGSTGTAYGSANNLIFYDITATKERARFDTSGNFGLNVIPSASLHVSGTTMLQQVIERVNLTGSAPPSTLNFDVTSGSILYRSASTSAAWTLNFRGDAGTTLNNMMYNNQSLTLALIVFHGATPYSASAYQVDGSSVTPRWQNGLVPTASANSTDMYSFTIIKTANAAFNVFGSQVRYS